MTGVYLIHFETPYKHAKHYLGFATDIYRRLNKHKSGTGARLMQVIQQEGIEWQLARVWKDATRNDERKMKNAGGGARYCPICKQFHEVDLGFQRSPKLKQFAK